MEKSKIKEYLLHEEKCVRNYAAKYFAEGCINDPQVTEILLDCLDSVVEESEAWGILLYVSKLPQTETTLERVHRLTLSDYNSKSHIDNIISKAELKLLKKMQHIRPRTKEGKNKLDNRMSLREKETDILWQMLWEHSEKGMHVNVGEFDYDYGTLIAEEICKRDDFDHNKFLGKINVKYPDDYSGWDEIYLCYMAGLLKCESAIPFLIKCVKIDSDFICERACDALIIIGTDEVVDSIENEYMNQPFHFRIYALGILEKLKTKKSEQLMLKLFPKENNVTLKTHLANGLCLHFSKEGIPEIMTLLKYGYDKMLTDLEESVYVNHVVNNIEHKDMGKWKEKIEESEKRMNEAKKNIMEGNLDLGKLHEGLTHLLDNRRENDRLTEFYSSPKRKTGRNSPCPCGSGKKYKKCCLM